MTKPKKGIRILIWAVSVLVILALLLAAFGFTWVKVTAPKSFPRVDGDIHLKGLDGAVDVYRDGMGIPNIYATNAHDLFMAQGYVHAQDRFWQMDFWRHIGSGRLSEMFGKSQVETDAFLRTLGWAQIAEQEYAVADPRGQSHVGCLRAGRQRLPGRA